MVRQDARKLEESTSKKDPILPFLGYAKGRVAKTTLFVNGLPEAKKKNQ